MIIKSFSSVAIIQRELKRVLEVFYSAYTNSITIYDNCYNNKLFIKITCNIQNSILYQLTAKHGFILTFRLTICE